MVQGVTRLQAGLPLADIGGKSHVKLEKYRHRLVGIKILFTKRDYVIGL
jgi:hypothetical protein